MYIYYTLNFYPSKVYSFFPFLHCCNYLTSVLITSLWTNYAAYLIRFSLLTFEHKNNSASFLLPSVSSLSRKRSVSKIKFVITLISPKWTQSFNWSIYFAGAVRVKYLPLFHISGDQNCHFPIKPIWIIRTFS